MTEIDAAAVPDLLRGGHLDMALVHEYDTVPFTTLCHTMTIRTCQSQGFEPRVAHRVDDFGAVLRLVSAGAGVVLAPQLGATASWRE